MGTRNKIVKLDMILPRLDDLWQYGSIVAALLWSILHKLDIVTLKYDPDSYWIRLSLSIVTKVQILGNTNTN